MNTAPLAFHNPRKLRGFTFVVDNLVQDEGEVRFMWGVQHAGMEMLREATLDIGDQVLTELGFDTEERSPIAEQELAMELCGKVQFEHAANAIRFSLPDGICKESICWYQREQQFL
jgi:hypothetical protein